MTQSTATNIREIKDLIAAGNLTTQKQIDTITRATEANATEIGKLSRTVAIFSQTVETLAKTTEANTTKAISDLTASFSGLREVVQLGFAEAKGEFKAFDEKIKHFDQRLSTGDFTRRGVTIGLTVTVVGELLLAFGKILFFGKLI